MSIYTYFENYDNFEASSDRATHFSYFHGIWAVRKCIFACLKGVSGHVEPRGIVFSLPEGKIGVWSARAIPRYLKTTQTDPKHTSNNVKNIKISLNRRRGASYMPKWAHLQQICMFTPPGGHIRGAPDTFKYIEILEIPDGGVSIYSLRIII